MKNKAGIVKKGLILLAGLVGAGASEGCGTALHHYGNTAAGLTYRQRMAAHALGRMADGAGNYVMNQEIARQGRSEVNVYGNPLPIGHATGWFDYSNVRPQKVEPQFFTAVWDDNGDDLVDSSKEIGTKKDIFSEGEHIAFVATNLPPRFSGRDNVFWSLIFDNKRNLVDQIKSSTPRYHSNFDYNFGIKGDLDRGVYLWECRLNGNTVGEREIIIR